LLRKTRHIAQLPAGWKIISVIGIPAWGSGFGRQGVIATELLTSTAAVSFSIDHDNSIGGLMNKQDLVNKVAELSGLSKASADGVIDATFAAITAALKAGDDVRLVGFGSFSVTQRAAKEGRNPRTGATIKIAASKAPKFTAGKGLKDAVNG
jgi:DNA-binding protein HU-beta